MDIHKKENERGEKEESEASVREKRQSKGYSPGAVAGLLIFIGLLVGSYWYAYAQKSAVKPDELKTTLIKYIEGNLVQPGTKVEIAEVVPEGDLFRADVNVGNQTIPTYATKDGKKFFPQAVDLAVPADGENKQAAAAANEDIPKSDKPAVDLYVMSFCPYGNKAEDTLKPVYDLLKNKVDFNFRYIVNTSGNTVQSLHGPVEVAQNEREACVLKEYGKDKWMELATYVNANCGRDGACWEAGAKGAGIDVNKVTACVDKNGVELMKADEKLAGAANANGSPTMLINGVSTKAVYQYGNAEAYKQAICSAFANPPEECAKELSSVAPASAASASGGGSCGG